VRRLRQVRPVGRSRTQTDPLPGLPLRDAFDSSLSTVITLSYLSRGEARRLIGSRLVRITEPSADLLYVLSGGLPRELVRLIRRAVDLQRAYTVGSSLLDEGQADGRPGADRGGAVPGGRPVESGQAPWSDGEDTKPKLAPVPLDLLTVALTAEQVAEQRRAVLIRGRVLEPCKARNTLLAWAGDPAANTRADFEDAERQEGKRSFERLARARQNFSLGPGYVQAAVTAVRTVWDLTEPPAVLLNRT
jgi:hypothetical protein